MDKNGNIFTQYFYIIKYVAVPVFNCELWLHKPYLKQAIREAQKREEEERQKRLEEQRQKQQKEEQDRKAREEAERLKVELQKKLEIEEKEREARRKRVEAIMLRTRGKTSGNNQSQVGREICVCVNTR